MALRSNYKDESTLVYLEDREQLALLGRQILRRVMNEATEQLAQQHLENQRHGKVESLLTSRADVERLLFQTTVRELGPGTVEA